MQQKLLVMNGKRMKNMVLDRPSKDQYYLRIAHEVAKRGTCVRRNYGAVIVNRDQIISTGYTGAPRGTANCCDQGYCAREAARVPPGERYELCRSVHAEMNAVIHAARSEMEGGTMYLVGLSAKDGTVFRCTEPCGLCKRVILNSGITSVVILESDGNAKAYEVDQWRRENDIGFSEEPKC